MRRLVAALFLLALQPCVAAAQGSATPPQNAAPPSLLVPKYAETPEGLKQLVTALVEATKSNDQQTLAAYAESLRLPNPDSWFKGVFGEVLGTEIAESHGALRERLQVSLFDGFSRILNDQYADFEIQRFEKPCEPASDALIYTALLMRRQRVPLYIAKFTKPQESRMRVMGFFAYVDGAFRYLGIVRDVGLRALPGSKVIRQGGNVQQAKLMNMVRPHYPEAARNNLIQGTVRLHALIGGNGTIDALRVIAGSCVLAEEAVKAVSQWRYNPTLLNGEPVIVVTTIDVVFTLGGQ